MFDEIEAALSPYYEEDDLIMNGEFHFDSNCNILSFRVDLLKDEYDVTIKIPSPPNSPSVYEVKFGNNTKLIENSDTLTLTKMLHKILEFFVIERDAGLESDLTSPNTPSGTFDWDKVPENELGYETIDENNTLEEDNSIFGVHSHLVNILYGLDASTSIKNANTVRLTISGKHLYNSRMTFYEISPTSGEPNRDKFTLSLRFAPDYTKNSQVPVVSVTSTSRVMGFGEQILNMSRIFIQQRWKQYTLKPISQLFTIEDPKFKFLLHLFASDSRSSSNNFAINEDTVVRTVRNEIANENSHYAMAIALWARKMNIQEAMKLFVHCGGALSSAQQATVQSLLANDSYPNFILEMITYLTLRVFDITNVCAICDRCIEVGKENSNKGQICTSFKCQFDYISLKVCASLPMRICPTIISQDILDNQDIVDILINMCYAAAKSDRKDLIFEPFPPFYETKNFNNSKVRNYERVIQTLENLPDIATMSKNCDNELMLKRLLGAEGYELTKWILTTKRVAMFKMSKDKAISKMQTEYQYMMLVDDPKVTRKFNENRKKYGSYTAFHGTAFENLHSVTHRRLIVASGTSLQTTGSAYGKGIYLAENSSTSLGYSRPGNSWPKSKFGDKNSMKCMFICEVVKLEGVPTIPNPYYVVDNAEAVSIRFFLFYPDGASVNVSADSLGLEKYINY